MRTVFVGGGERWGFVGGKGGEREREREGGKGERGRRGVKRIAERRRRRRLLTFGDELAVYFWRMVEFR